MRRTIGFIFITLITTSCATTFVERENTWKPKGEVPALMVHYSVVDQYSLSQGQTVMDVRRTDGSIAAEVGAFIEIWKTLPGYGPLAKIASFKFVRFL